jgi:uncharacterized metal-binding protein
MPGFKTHRDVSLYVLCPLTFAATWVIAGGHARLDAATAKEIAASLAVAAGAYAGNTFLSPDLDIPSAPYNHWKFARFIWLPYQIAIRHRSPVSHGVITGAVIQHLYVMLALILIATVCMAAWNYVFIPFTDFGPRLYGGQPIGVTIIDIFRVVTTPLKWAWYWLFLLGNTIGAAAHCIMDFADSRRRWQYRGQREVPSSDDEIQAVRGLIWER